MIPKHGRTAQMCTLQISTPLLLQHLQDLFRDTGVSRLLEGLYKEGSVQLRLPLECNACCVYRSFLCAGQSAHSMQDSIRKITSFHRSRSACVQAPGKHEDVSDNLAYQTQGNFPVSNITHITVAQIQFCSRNLNPHSQCILTFRELAKCLPL